MHRIRSLAGSSLEWPESVTVSGRITLADGRFYLKLLVRDEAEVRQRVIVSESCAELTGAAAVTLLLLLGIALDAPALTADTAPEATPGNEERIDDQLPKVGARSDKNAGDSRGGLTGKQPADNSQAQIRASSTPNERRWGLVLRAPSIVVESGPLPRASLGVGLGGGVRLQSWRVLLDCRLYSKQVVTIPDSVDGLGADVHRATAELGLCHGWRSRSLEVAPCSGLAIEFLSARGFGAGVTPQIRTVVWAAPMVGFTGYWHVFGSLAVSAQLAGYLELSRPQIVIDGVGDVTRLKPLAASAALGLEWST